MNSLREISCASWIASTSTAHAFSLGLHDVPKRVIEMFILG
jgi:hypothetical protein